MRESSHTVVSAAIAAWLGFPVGAIFAAVSLLWWVAWVAFGGVIACALWAHVHHYRKDST